MHRLKTKGKGVLFLKLIAISLTLYSCFPARVLKYNVADIKDPDKFDAVKIQNDSANIYKFIDATSPSIFALPKSLGISDTNNFSKYLDKGKTVAFLVIRNDSILYENYFDGYAESSPIPSFSVSKSFVSALFGIAIKEGFIRTINDPINYFITEYTHMNHISLKHIIDMQAGFVFGEHYFNPFAEVAKYYYGRNLVRFMSQLKSKKKNLGMFNYQSVNTQILAEVIERETRNRISSYLEWKIWRPLQMEYPATWSVDDKGKVKAFCCINARARDFAKLGRLYLNGGSWEGRQVVPKAWVDSSLYFSEGKNEFIYSNHWWHSVDETPYSDSINLDKLKKPYLIKKNKKGEKEMIIQPHGDTFARGVLGQFIYLDPEANMIIVRLGKGFGSKPWIKLFRAIVEENS